MNEINGKNKKKYFNEIVKIISGPNEWSNGRGPKDMSMAHHSPMFYLSMCPPTPHLLPRYDTHNGRSLQSLRRYQAHHVLLNRRDAVTLKSQSLFNKRFLLVATQIYLFNSIWDHNFQVENYSKSFIWLQKLNKSSFVCDLINREI